MKIRDIKYLFNIDYTALSQAIDVSKRELSTMSNYELDLVDASLVDKLVEFTGYDRRVLTQMTLRQVVADVSERRSRDAK